MNAIDHEELTAILADTGKRHHQAFLSADGVDPEWPLWYAAHIQATVWDRFGSLPTRSQLVALLVEAERETEGSGQPWPRAYANFILSNYRS